MLHFNQLKVYIDNSVLLLVMYVPVLFTLVSLASPSVL